MNLKGIAETANDDRAVVDLLFFPTGGGKTEAYLGLAAFSLVLRRMRHPGIASAGVGVLMRYTLRLLTLDQLSRAATLICAMEMERQQNADKLARLEAERALRDQNKLTYEELQRHCRAQLGGFKVPKELIVQDELPRNPSGKVLKRVLREQLSKSRS